MESKENRRISISGLIYLTLFVVFVTLGIVVKRAFGHAEFMTMFHLPAAVFLVLAGYQLTSTSRKKYQRQVREWKESRREPPLR